MLLLSGLPNDLTKLNLDDVGSKQTQTMCPSGEQTLYTAINSGNKTQL